MTGNISYLSEHEPYDGGYVSFGQGGGKITGKGIIKTGKLEFENVYFVKELKYNLFSVSQICDNKNSVMFTDSECIVLGKDFKLKDDTNVLLRTPRQHNMYSIDLNNVVPYKNLTCLVSKASVDERKQHKASCKTKLVNFMSKPLHTLHMDLFGPTSVSSLNHKWYCLVVTNDFSRCDNGGEFKNKEMNEFCTKKGIKREFSNARTPQQNGVAERRNRTLIEAARTMLADAKLHVTFWAEVVNTVCYVQNRVLVNKSQNKTPYELFNSRTPAIGFLRPFGCHVMILNTLDHLEKFDAKGDEGTNDVASQAVKKDVSSLRYIALPNCSPVPTACLDISLETSSDSRLISKEVLSQEETPSLDNALTLSNRFEDTNRVEADLRNMESSIPASPTSTFRIHKDHPKSQIIGPVDTPVQTRHKFKEMEEHSFIATIHQKTTLDLLQFCLFLCFLSQEEPKKIFDALKDPSWVEAMQEELLQFKIQNVWILVDCPKGIRPIGTKWEEVIDYEEVFAPVARIKAIRLFLTYALFMGFTVYQMDVKSAFLYGTIHKEVYVMQPPRFQDLEFSDRVSKVEKEMYGLHQAPRAWYGTLSKYLLDNGFQRGTIDQTLFIRKHRRDFLLVQVYVNDIIIGSSNPQLCREFEVLMHEKFQMNAMGKLNFFLGLQVLQKKDGIFLLQDKYVGDILKKFRYSDVRSANTPIDKENPWRKDGPSKDVELHLYRSMIGSLMYLTTSRPDIMFAVCACAKHQVTPKECHLHAVRRIFKYLKGHPKLGLWYPKESPFNLVAYSDSDYCGATQDRKSTTGGCQFLGRRLISWQCKKQTIVATSITKAEYVAAASGCGQKTEHNIDFHHIVDFIEASHIRQYSRRATRITQSKSLSPAADEPTSLLRDDSQGEAFPTVTTLDAGQDRENIIKTSALPHESTPRVTSLDADEGSMQQQLQELMDLFTGLQRQQTQMADKIKDQDLEISSLKVRVKILKDKDIGREEPQEDALIKGETVSVSPVSAIFTTASVVTPYSRRLREISAKDKGKEKVVESNVPKKKNLQEQIDAQVAREMEEEFTRDNQRLSEQLAKDSEIARLHDEDELKMMIEGLDRSNEIIAKHLPEYEQAAVDLTMGEKIELINELPKWNVHVTIVHQTKDLHTADYTQLYDFLKYNQKEVDELKAKRLVKTQDPLALMANSNNPYAFLAPHQDQSSINQNYLQQPMPNPEDITDPTTATVQNLYGTPRESRHESGEAMSARRSEQPQKGRRR
nr:retrovirus-related Pol polyprotein from transposon TNT 1-94 [Tanacetum cinerariifolium]